MKCGECGDSFVIELVEDALLQKFSPTFDEVTIDIPHSGLCPGCREQQRLSFRNEWNFYYRKCDHSGEDLIAIYPQDSPYTIFGQTHWWSDEYDPLAFGRNFDFSRTFFEQFDELNRDVPKVAIQNAKSQNSLYTNYSLENKNCYMAVGSGRSENLYYCYRVWSSKDIGDSYDLQNCELCYECVQSSDLYESAYARNCHNSSNLLYCNNCRSCSDCIACVNLRGQKYCILNQQLTEADYRRQVGELLGNPQAILRQYNLLLRTSGVPEFYQINCEDCVGDQLLNCSRTIHCFSLKESQDCLYCGNGEKNIDCLDANFCDSCELQYFSTNLQSNYRVLFGALVWYTNHGCYLANCFNSSNLFGCSGMKKNSYCILNKQYSEDRYEKLVLKIVRHMQETGEWGQFFPIRISPFSFNKTIGFEYYPVGKKEALEKGWSWENDLNSGSSRAKSSDLQTCEVSGKLFRVSTQELVLLERLNLQPPKKCPQVRHVERMAGIKRAIANY